MRGWDKEGRVFRKNWKHFERALSLATVVFFSEEDVDSTEKAVESYRSYTMVVITRGRGGATVYTQDRDYPVPAFQTTEVDPTGAGDVFAAAFLIKYNETRDPVEAATFANCVASFVIERKGVYGIPFSEEVEERLTIGARYN